MNTELSVRRCRSAKSLSNLLDEIEAERETKPDWIHLEADCRLDRLSEADRERTLQRLHRSVLTGFRASNVRPGNTRKRLDYWRSVARNGFHDFSENGWMKCYDSPFVHNYDYVTSYLEHGLEALDPYLLYSSVLGTHEYTIGDFVRTHLCEDVKTVVEPMAGSAEFAYSGHFQFPDFRYVMFDLDHEAKAHVEGLPWLADTERHYVIADVLDEDIWSQVKSLTTGRSLAYIGKQSHHFFGAKQLHKLLRLATEHVDYLVLEVLEPSIVSDLGSEDELTRPEMKDAGFRIALVDEPGKTPNPLTNALSFRLDVWDKKTRRTLFKYDDWTSWQHPTLVALARILDLQAYYYHSEFEQFELVDEHTEESDCLENVTFMLFTRHQ